MRSRWVTTYRTLSWLGTPLVLLAFTAYLLGFISANSANAIIGLAVLAVAIVSPWPIRLIGLMAGLVILATGGWLDLEGWRFLQRPMSGMP